MRQSFLDRLLAPSKISLLATLACTLESLRQLQQPLGGIGTASGSVTSVSFRHNSTQSVTLTVMDGEGQVASVSQVVRVK